MSIKMQDVSYNYGHEDVIKKINLDKLKESILLQSEILDLKASFSGQAKGGKRIK